MGWYEALLGGMVGSIRHLFRMARRIRHMLPALSLAIPLAISSATLANGTQRPVTPQPAMTVWQTIDALARQLPLSQAAV